VDDLLDIARINRGKLTLRLEPLDLVDVLENAIDAARPLIDANRHKLVVSIPSSSIPVEGDMTRLSQVFQNLLNNAAKYTDPGGQITLVTRLEDDAVLIEVSDNGIGIPASILPHVFDMFIQGDQSLERTRGGLGIGLTLVHTLVQLHRGTISVSSSGVLGEGSQFSVRLPLRKTATLSLPPSGVTSTDGTVRHRVVVVDDNVDSAETLGRLLELMGHEVRTAHDGEAALGVVTQFQPDIVFLDIGLPKLNGYEVAKRIRSDGASSPAMRLIALTGWGQEGDRLRSKDAGFDFHLTKPADPEQIVRIMRGDTFIRS
jgi:CheY-like chemotaxis protein/two-component sensor histidine kinase